MRGPRRSFVAGSSGVWKRELAVVAAVGGGGRVSGSRWGGGAKPAGGIAGARSSAPPRTWSWADANNELAGVSPGQRRPGARLRTGTVSRGPSSAFGGRPNAPSVWDGRPNPSSAWGGRPNPSSARGGRPNPSSVWDERPNPSPAWGGRPNPSST